MEAERVGVGQPRAVAAFDLVANFEQVERLATLISENRLIPAHFRGKPSEVVRAVDLAQRTGFDPWSMMEQLYEVHGRLGMQAKLQIALVNRARVLDGVIQHEFTGSNADKTRACRAYARTVAGQDIEAVVSWEDVQREGWDRRAGSKWRTIPDVMFAYRSSAWLINRYVPEATFGMSTVEELQDAPPVEVSAEVVERRELNAALNAEIDAEADSGAEGAPEGVVTLPPWDEWKDDAVGGSWDIKHHSWEFLASQEPGSEVFETMAENWARVADKMDSYHPPARLMCMKLRHVLSMAEIPGPAEPEYLTSAKAILDEEPEPEPSSLAAQIDAAPETTDAEDADFFGKPG